MNWFVMLLKVLNMIVWYFVVFCFFFFLVGFVNGICEWWIYYVLDVSIYFLVIVYFVVVLIFMVIYIYGYREFVKGFCYFWMGVFYSVLFFIEIVFDYLIDFFYDLDVMDILIMVSIVVYCFRVLIVRLCCKLFMKLFFLYLKSFFFFWVFY